MTRRTHKRRKPTSERGPGRPGRPPLGDAARSVRLQIFVTPAVDARLSGAAGAATRIARLKDPEAPAVKPSTLAADMLERALDTESIEPIEPTT